MAFMYVLLSFILTPFRVMLFRRSVVYASYVLSGAPITLRGPRSPPPPEDGHNRCEEEVIKVLLLDSTPRRRLSVTETQVLLDFLGVPRGDGCCEIK